MIRVPRGTPVLTAEQMRAAEQACFDAGVSQEELMERAGTAVAREAARFAFGRPVLVLAGPGNNGGDAYVVARLLRQWGHDVIVAALGGKEAGAAGMMRSRWDGETVTLDDAEPRPVLVDGLFGTGMSRALEGEARKALHRLSQAAAFVLAIDLPSGFATDSGEDLGGAPATATVALGALKPAHLLMPALERCGTVLHADIGIPGESDICSLSRPHLVAPARDSHKYSRGLVLVVEGEMPGAARLSARAALHGGAGYVMLAGQGGGGNGPDALVHRSVESADDLQHLLGDDRISAVVIGPGLGRGERSQALLGVAIACEHRLVIDGDALTLLGRDAERRISGRTAETVLTPHEGEFGRMFDDGDGGKLDRTVSAARRICATIVHKGPDTVIAHPDGRVVMSGDSSPWLSTAGTGDVLAGLCGARMAKGNAHAAAEAVWLHTRAAALAGPAFCADDLIGRIPDAIGECV
ncbi:NAD(P)H-hydrate dehydratase [Stakelama marina]|uniref:Bifunctional NAD(P)H-hydrate repair enzyme n=1 Tax=Stakelama marina TaxID=2826939 RepID=A0A8T4IH77_9SPHN|nr:NAD(P)H-hydrate dehydratase [Stakelama marina]MBR0551649.1 NAD(P)H-hydrate dehydratase [Stakelama marina]